MISERTAYQTLPSRPCFLRDYVHYAAMCTDANAAFHIAGGLVLLAQTLPTNMGIPLGGRPLRGNFYALCVGPSTTARKSTGVVMAQGMLEDAGFESVLESPGSAEGLLEAIRQMAGRSLIAYPEFGSFLAQTEMKYATPIKTLLTDAYDGGSLGRALANKRRGAVKDARVSVFGGSTLYYLERHTEPVDWTGGFLARFFTIYANAEREYPLQPPNPPGKKQLMDRLNQFIHIDTTAGECQGFDAEATKLWTDWYHKCKEMTTKSVQATRASISRAHGMAQKIALLLGWDFGTARTGEPWWIGTEELEPAIAMTDLHIESVLEIGEHLAPTRDLRDRMAVLDAMPPKRGLTLGQVITQSKVGLKKRVQDLLGTLEEEGLVRRVSANDGRTDLYFRVNGMTVEAVEGIPLDIDNLTVLGEEDLNAEQKGGEAGGDEPELLE